MIRRKYIEMILIFTGIEIGFRPVMIKRKYIGIDPNFTAVEM